MENDQEEIEEKSVIPGRNATETEIKHAAALILSDAGMSNRHIAQTVERTDVTICNVLKKMKRESFLHPRKVKLASKLAEKIMNECLKPAADADPRVKMSDGARMIEQVIARSEPLKSDAPGSVSQTFIHINMDAFRHKM